MKKNFYFLIFTLLSFLTTPLFTKNSFAETALNLNIKKVLHIEFTQDIGKALSVTSGEETSQNQRLKVSQMQ